MKKENAILYCEGAFNTTNGKTAHGLVRFTERFDIIAVIDSRYAEKDAGEVLDGKPNNIPIKGSVEEAVAFAETQGHPADCLVIGLAPDGGKLPPAARRDIIKAIEKGLDVISGLHDFLTEDPEISQLASARNTRLFDIRKTPPRSQLHFFSGKIEEVDCLKLAVLGTDSALGKRTTAWIIVHGLRRNGFKAEMVGTGQTAWLQGAAYSVVFDSLINDFVSGEIEHAVHTAWKENHPDAIIIEGQGSLLNPAYPGGFEILAAGRPDHIILQHAPKRLEYDGFPGYALHPLDHQIRALEMISGKKVIAITLNHENMKPEEVSGECALITRQTGLPCFDVLLHGPDKLVEVIAPFIKNKDHGR